MVKKTQQNDENTRINVDGGAEVQTDDQGDKNTRINVDGGVVQTDDQGDSECVKAAVNRT